MIHKLSNTSLAHSSFRLPALLRLATVLLALLSLASVIAQGDWKTAAEVSAAGFLVLCVLLAPDLLAFVMLLVFLAGSAPTTNPAEPAQQLRWVFLVALTFALLCRYFLSKSSWVWHPMFFSLALFVLLAGISSSYSTNVLMSFLKAASFGCLLLLAVLYGGLAAREKTGKGCKLLEHFYWLTVVVMLACLVWLLLPEPPQGMYFSGPFANPNSLGAFVALTIPVLVFKVSQPLRKNSAQRIANIALLISTMVFLLMSRSRGGIVAALLACGWWLYFSYRRIFVLYLVTTLLCGVIIWAYFPSYINTLYETYVQKGQTYILEYREDMLIQSWEAAKENPLLGSGFGVSRSYSEEWRPTFKTGATAREKGNSYLALVEEVGITGAVLLLWPIGWLLWRTMRWITRAQKLGQRTPEYWTTLTLSACIIGGLWDAFFEAWLTAAGFWGTVMFWMAFGVLACRLFGLRSSATRTNRA